MISGVLPVVDDEMMAEYHRLTTDLGVRGLLIFSNIEGLPLDDDSMWPLYAAAAADDVPIWIHPQHGYSDPGEEGSAAPTLRLAVRTTLASPGTGRSRCWTRSRSLGLSAADQELLLGANLGRIMRL